MVLCTVGIAATDTNMNVKQHGSEVAAVLETIHSLASEVIDLKRARGNANSRSATALYCPLSLTVFSVTMPIVITLKPNAIQTCQARNRPVDQLAADLLGRYSNHLAQRLLKVF